MTIPNPRNENLQQLLPLIQQRFPQATIRKVFLSPESIFIPHDNFKFILRPKGDGLKVEHTLPLLYSLGAVILSALIVSGVMSLIYGELMLGFGGAIWIILGVFIVKYIFKVIKKADFDAFENDITNAVAS